MAFLKTTLRVLGVLLLAGAVLGGVAWYKLLRDVVPPATADDARWFRYGSLGGEAAQGIPYWIWIVLPRIFPDLMPGPGGYASFGLAWEEGEELPIGFTLRTVGFPRVGNNCAVCHVGSYRLRPDDKPRFASGAPAHTFDVGALFDFFARAAADSRFNSSRILAEIDTMYALGWLDRLLYRHLIIPLTRKAFLQQGRMLAFAHRPGRAAWGPGRDDSFNLPKYFLAGMPVDDSHGPADFNSAWNLAARRGDGLLLNWCGESPAVRTVLVDSAIGVGARPGAQFEQDLARLDRFLSALQPPPWPFQGPPHGVRPELAARGEAVWQRECAACHEPGGARCNRVIPLAEIGTDGERLAVWSPEAARATDAAIEGDLGADRPDLQYHAGYLAAPLDGIWLRAPYLHNGSVPTLRALLQPPDRRPVIFHRGCDVIDPVDVGFVSTGPVAERRGHRFDTRQRGNGNGGHSYGTALPAADQDALLEYLKTK